MDKSALDKFGEFVITKIRDVAIMNTRATLEGRMRGPASLFIQKALAGLNEEQQEGLRALVTMSVDQTLHFLLFGLENEEDITVAVVKDDGEVVPSIRDLCDGLAAEQTDWTLRYSQTPPTFK